MAEHPPQRPNKRRFLGRPGIERVVSIACLIWLVLGFVVFALFRLGR
jgi:hypothetical protein